MLLDASTLTTIIPSRSARLHHTCRVSVATAFCLSFFRANTVRMLCKRSASLMTSTSGSETMLTMKVRSCSSSSLPSPIPRLWPDCRAAKVHSGPCRHLTTLSVQSTSERDTSRYCLFGTPHTANDDMQSMLSSPAMQHSRYAAANQLLFTLFAKMLLSCMLGL